LDNNLNPLDVMQECAQLALMGKGYTKTNPVVGAVVADRGNIVSRGWHEEFGGPHAEVNAIDSSPVSVEGLDLYVTLEPCSHFGKTPPCAQKIVESGIKRVFIGCADPNPANAGKGVDYLKNNGVEVFIGYREELCASIIEDFTKYIIHKKPYYTFKTAQSLDGKIASCTGDSKWITGESARAYTHYLRAVSDAVLVGVNTVICDDPELNVRLIKSDRDPYKVVLDPKGRMPSDRKLVKNSPEKLIYVTERKTALSDELSSRGADVIYIPLKNETIDLDMLSNELINRNILNVLIEGGGRTAGTFFDAGLVDRANLFTAPVILGGDKVSVGGKGVATVAGGHKLEEMQTRQFDKDILISGKTKDYTAHVLRLTEEIRGRCSCGCGKNRC